MGRSITEKVRKIAKPIIDQLNYDLVDMEYKKEGPSWYLRFFIDKPGGVTIEDCQIVSEKVGKELDKHDPIPNSYYLEVSSPGIDRPLKTEKDFKRHEGEEVEIKTYERINGRKKFKATIEGFQNGNVVLSVDGETVEIPLEKIALAKLAVEF